MKKLLFFASLVIIGQSMIAMTPQQGDAYKEQMERLNDQVQQAARRHLDLYGIIGVDAHATTQEILGAFHGKMGQLYKKSNSGGYKLSLDEVKRLNQARDILTDPEARAAYDRAVIDLNR